MNGNTRVTVLANAKDTLSALKKLTTWADEVHMTYAWANSSDGKAAHWQLLPVDKIKRAVIGIHFAQTEPLVLRTLSKKPNKMKVIEDTSGVFHPKLIIGIKGTVLIALLGSSNLTAGGFHGNTEINVLVEGDVNSASSVALRRFMDDQWESPRAFEPDKDWYDRYEKAYEGRPKPPRVPSKKRSARSVISNVNDLDVSWDDYYNLIVEQERRSLADGNVIHIFDHVDGSYVQEIDNCQQAFALYTSFSDMPEQSRKLVSGWGGGTTGLFGSMRGAGNFKNLVRQHPDILSQHLDTVPFTGQFASPQINQYLNNMLGIDGVNLGTATRLLGVKRPDLYMPVNDGNKKRIRDIFQRAPSTVSGYLKLHEILWSFPWFSAPEPAKNSERRVWRARVALLDAVLYEIPEKLL